MKTIGGLRNTRHRGTDRIDWIIKLTLAAYHIVSIPNPNATKGMSAPDAPENTPIGRKTPLETSISSATTSLTKCTSVSQPLIQ